MSEAVLESEEYRTIFFLYLPDISLNGRELRYVES